MTAQNTTTQVHHTPSQELYDNPITQEALGQLIAKLEPLIQGHRLDNLIDLASLTSDLVDMTDDKMVEKLMSAYESSISASWAAGDALCQQQGRTDGSATQSDETDKTIKRP